VFENSPLRPARQISVEVSIAATGARLKERDGSAVDAVRKSRAAAASRAWEIHGPGQSGLHSLFELKDATSSPHRSISIFVRARRLADGKAARVLPGGEAARFATHYEAPLALTGRLLRVEVIMDNDQRLDGDAVGRAVLVRE
jgi:hypothetical protein